jgi:hypothetical protein
MSEGGNNILLKLIFWFLKINNILKEFEEPATLLNDQNSLFYRLVNQTGDQSVRDLTKIANKVYHQL